jgi:hypothetical protein
MRKAVKTPSLQVNYRGNCLPLHDISCPFIPLSLPLPFLSPSLPSSLSPFLLSTPSIICEPSFPALLTLINLTAHNFPNSVLPLSPLVSLLPFSLLPSLSMLSPTSHLSHSCFPLFTASISHIFSLFHSLSLPLSYCFNSYVFLGMTFFLSSGLRNWVETILTIKSNNKNIVEKKENIL